MPSIINALTASGGGVAITGDATGNLALQTAGNTAVTVNTSKGVQFDNCIGVGNATPSTSGAGITFPATQSASTDANTLDDYEEGTFTPTVIGSSTAGTATYSIQTGTYTKIGRMVQVQLFLSWSGGTGTGNLQIAGLPFGSNSSSNNFAWANGYSSNLVLAANNLFYANISNGTSIIAIDQYPVGGGAASNVAYDAAASIGISIVYQV